MRRARPLTAHQQAVERNRNQRVEYILSRGLRKRHHESKKRRKQDGAIYRALKRAEQAKNLVFEDSEAEDSYKKDPGIFRERGFIGLVQLEEEIEDYGEEIAAYAAAFRRMGRRLDRWDGQKGLNLGVVGTNRIPQSKPKAINGHGVSRDNDETEDERTQHSKSKQVGNGDADMDEDLDEMDKELLGLGSGDEAEPDEDLDDVEKELLGYGGGGDETEEDNSDGMDVD
jgi:Ino eighty subunit 1